MGRKNDLRKLTERLATSREVQLSKWDLEELAKIKYFELDAYGCMVENGLNRKPEVLRGENHGLEIIYFSHESGRYIYPDESFVYDQIEQMTIENPKRLICIGNWANGISPLSIKVKDKELEEANDTFRRKREMGGLILSHTTKAIIDIDIKDYIGRLETFLDSLIQPQLVNHSQ